MSVERCALLSATHQRLRTRERLGRAACVSTEWQEGLLAQRASRTEEKEQEQQTRRKDPPRSGARKGKGAAAASHGSRQVAQARSRAQEHGTGAVLGALLLYLADAAAGVRGHVSEECCSTHAPRDEER